MIIMLSGNKKIYNFYIFSRFQQYARARYVHMWTLRSEMYFHDRIYILSLKLKLINFSPAIEIKKKKLRFLVISVLPS